MGVAHSQSVDEGARTQASDSGLQYRHIYYIYIATRAAGPPVIYSICSAKTTNPRMLCCYASILLKQTLSICFLDLVA